MNIRSGSCVALASIGLSIASCRTDAPGELGAGNAIESATAAVRIAELRARFANAEGSILATAVATGFEPSLSLIHISEPTRPY